jgi:uncharacterized protein
VSQQEKLKDLLDYLARALAREKDAVSVSVDDKENETVLLLRVADDDMGRVIGKGGKTAKAIRSLIKAASDPKGKKVSVEIVE